MTFSFSTEDHDEDEDDDRSLGRLFQSAYNLSPPDAAGGAGCSVTFVATGSGSLSSGNGSQVAMDRHLPVSLDLDNDPMSRLFAESDHDDDDDEDDVMGLDDSFARVVAGKQLQDVYFKYKIALTFVILNVEKHSRCN